MATTSGYDYGIRQGLVNKGVNSADIAYNPGTGYVTVKGQNAIKAPKVYNGTSFTTQQDFNTQYDAFNKAQQQQQPAQTGFQPTGMAGETTGTGYGLSLARTGYQPTGMAGTTPQSAPAYAPQGTGYAPPAAPSIDQRIAELYSALQNQQAFDPYNSSAYAAAQAQADRATQQGIRGAQEAYGSAGFGRSTALGERAQRIGQEGTEYLMTQVLPQIQTQEEARRQQQFQNLFTLLSPQQEQQQFAEQVARERFNQDMQQRQFAEQTAQGRAGLTGSLITPEEQQLQQAMQALAAFKGQTERNWADMTPEQRASALAEGNLQRSNIQALGGDPNLFGAGVTSAQATQNIGRAGTPTLAGQAQQLTAQGQQFEQEFALDQFAYQQARDKIADQQYQQKFDEDVRRFGLEYALNEAVQNRQLAQTDARIALDQAQEARISAGGSGGGGGGGGSAGSSSYKPSTESTIQDINLPRTAASMETYIINKLPGGKYVAGPPSPNQQELIENMILDNPNLSEADMVKLYKKFGIPLPE